MSFGISAAAWTAIAATTTAAYSIYSGQQQAKANSAAMQQAQANALKQEKAADEASNRANQKRPDTMALLSAAQQSGKAGASGTMLTGPQGVDPNLLALGKSTLLGQ